MTFAVLWGLSVMSMILSEEILFLNEQEVRELLTVEDAISAAEDVFLHVGLAAYMLSRLP